MNLTLPLTLEMPSSEPELAIEWETWGEDSSIELCEVRLDFDGMGQHQPYFQPETQANIIFQSFLLSHCLLFMVLNWV
jgi:hypothetical protein